MGEAAHAGARGAILLEKLCLHLRGLFVDFGLCVGAARKGFEMGGMQHPVVRRPIGSGHNSGVNN